MDAQRNTVQFSAASLGVSETRGANRAEENAAAKKQRLICSAIRTLLKEGLETELVLL